MTFEEAIELSRETARFLGGKQQEAIELVCRYAERKRRQSSAAIESFRIANDHLKKDKEK